MEDISLDQELEAFDFSHIHSVRKGLLEQLLMMQRSRNHAGELKSRLRAAKLQEEDLDWVAAARGTEQNPDQNR